MYDELNWDLFMQQQNEGQYPKICIPFSLNTPYLQKEFYLDLIIWNLSPENLEMTKKVTNYILNNFNKLFETAWTATFYRMCNMDNSPVEGHTLAEFYQEQIDVEYYTKMAEAGHEHSYYLIQLEINSDHLLDGIARYCFVVATICEYRKWMISDDNMRCYMVDNRCWATDTNNDDMQMLEATELCDRLYQNPFQKDSFAKAYEKMDDENFQYADSFHA